MTHEKLKNCIGQYRELKKDLWWLKKWGIQKVKGYDFGVYYNDFDGHWKLSWYDPENEHRIANVEDIFETKEEAEWHEEFGCIKRTESLELPTWEEAKLLIDCTKHPFYGKDTTLYDLWLSPEENWCGIYVDDRFEIEHFEPLTKENYILACRKCKELFLGENE